MDMDRELLSVNIFDASIEFGIGCVANLAQYIDSFNINSMLIVTDPGVLDAGIVDKVTQNLDESTAKYSIFSDVQPNPTDKNVMDGLSAYTEGKCNAIIGLGGGSPIDAAKGIRAVANNPAHISKYYFPEAVPGDMPPLIAIPTTSGTGTEVSRGGVITDTRNNQKRLVITGPPSLAVVDPELTVSMPPSLTAATGMDALCHSIEAYTSNRYNPLAGAIAIGGIKLVAENLRRAVNDGNDIEARRNMAMASTMGALAFKKGLGAVHSLAHQLSTDAGMPHGVANAIVLPHVMEFNLEAATQEYADIAQAMDVDTSGMSVIEAARGSIEAVRQLMQDIGITNRLRDAGVDAGIIPAMAEKAMDDHCHHANSRECTQRDMVDLYEAAF